MSRLSPTRRPYWAVLGLVVAAVGLFPSNLGAIHVDAVPGSPAPALHGSQPEGWVASAHEVAAIPTGAAGSTSPAESSSANWINAAPNSTLELPSDKLMASAWDSADGYLLVTGGDGPSAIYNQSWAYASGHWTDLVTSGAVGPVYAESMTYDASLGEVVLFGGLRSSSPLEYTNTTWTYLAGVWTPHITDPAPPGRAGASLVYDPALHGDLLFGGLNLSTTTTVLGDTWLYRNGSWSELSTTGAPSARWLCNVAYDPALSAVVLYGGAYANETAIDGTYEFANGTWSEVSADQPGPLAASLMDYDPDLGAVVLTDGFNATAGFPTATWTFNGATWSRLTTTGSNIARYSAVGNWDPVDHEFVLAGDTSSAETIALVTPVTVVSLGGPAEGEAGRWASFHPNITGGPRPLRFSWTFGVSPGNTTENASWAFSTPGNYSIGLELVASNGSRSSASETFQVVGGPAVGIGYPTSGVDATAAAAFTANVIGGVAPFNVSWSFGDGGYANGTNVSHRYAAPGVFPVSATVVDADGGRISDTVQVVVNAPPSLVFNYSYPATAPTEVGVPTPLGVTVNGGMPPFAVTWNVPGQAPTTEPSPTVVFSTSGTFSINASVTDADGVSVAENASVVVVAAMTLKISVPTEIVAGTSVRFSVNVSGGFGPFSMTWAFPGSGQAPSAITGDHDFPSPGPRSVEVWVNDSAGGSARSEANFTVQPVAYSSTSSGSGGLTPAEGIGIVVVVVVAAVAVVLAIRSRRRPPAT